MTGGFVSSPTPAPDPAPSPPSSGPRVEHDGFYPGVDLTHMRETMRIGEVVTQARLTEVAKVGMVATGRELRRWRAVQVAAGAATLDAIEAEQIDFENVLIVSYRRAVYSYAAAELAETHRDITATGDGADRGEQKALTADEHRRNATYAIRDILDVERVDSELI